MPLPVQIVQRCPSHQAGPTVQIRRKNVRRRIRFWRPPRTPEPWEALTDEEDRVEENTGNDDSDLEGAEKIRFSRLIAWQQIARWTKTEKSEEDVQALILQAATDH